MRVQHICIALACCLVLHATTVCAAGRQYTDEAESDRVTQLPGLGEVNDFAMFSG